eukprot:1106261-Rhodomonas_salina.1
MPVRGACKSERRRACGAAVCGAAGGEGGPWGVRQGQSSPAPHRQRPRRRCTVSAQAFVLLFLLLLLWLVVDKECGGEDGWRVDVERAGVHWQAGGADVALAAKRPAPQHAHLPRPARRVSPPPRAVACAAFASVRRRSAARATHTLLRSATLLAEVAERDNASASGADAGVAA